MTVQCNHDFVHDAYRETLQNEVHMEHFWLKIGHWTCLPILDQIIKTNMCLVYSVVSD